VGGASASPSDPTKVSAARTQSPTTARVPNSPATSSGALGPRLPGVVVGHYVDWNLYRVVYMVGIAGESPRAVEEWRLSPRSEGEER